MNRGGTVRYLIKRLAFLLFTLWLAVTLNFLIPRLMPGNPAQIMVQKLVGEGPVNPQLVRAVGIMLGLPRGTLWHQYVLYVHNLLHGNFGVSYTYFPYPVMAVIAQALPWTLILLGTTTIITFILGTALGALAASRRGTWFDTTATITANFTATFPFFWTALMALYVLGFVLHWFPQSGGYDAAMMPQWSATFVLSAVYHSVLPALVIVVTGTGGWLFGMRNNMIHVLGEDYVRLAMAKGLPRREIALAYGARNAILPNLTGFAMSLGTLVGGSILVETVFSYPGMGYLLFNAVGNSDYPLMQTIFLFITIGTLIANFVADILYGVLDPRTRRGGVSA